MPFDQQHHFAIRGQGSQGQSLQQLQQPRAVAQIGAGQFADHPGMDKHATLAEQLGQPGQAMRCGRIP